MLIVVTILITGNIASALSVTFVSRSLPSSGVVGSNSTFSAEIEYDSSPIYFADGYFHVEIPTLYNQPTSIGGSWSSNSWEFVQKVGTMTGVRVYEARRSFIVIGKTNRAGIFRANAARTGSSQSYIGTGNTLIPAHYFRNVTITNPNPPSPSPPSPPPGVEPFNIHN